MRKKQNGIYLLLCVLLLNVSACGSSYDSDDESPDSPATAVGGANNPQRPAVQSFSIGTDADHPALRNMDGALGSVRDTAMTVMNGDRIEIKPNCLLREHRKAVDPLVVREDHNVCTQTAEVCVASVPIFQRQCDDHCSVCIKCTFVGCFPWRCCDTVCQDVHVGDRCVATQTQCTQNQNQWMETSTFVGLDTPETVKDTAPMNTAALLTEGLKLRFSFLDPSGSSQRVDCGLGQFKPEADAEKFTLHLRNVDGCPSIFVDGAKSQPTLSVVNGMNMPVPYSQGTLVKTWDGRVLDRPQDATYLPMIDFLGTVSVFATPTSN